MRNGTIDAMLAQRQHEAVVDKAMAGLQVSRVGLTYVIQLAYTSPSPTKAALLANTFAKGYLTQQLDAKFDATREANEWLNGKVADLRQQLTDAETAVEQYKAANNLLSANGATLTEQEISTLDQQLATARAQQAEADAALEAAKMQMARGGNGADVGAAVDSPTIQALRAQRATLMQKIADLSGRYGERYPEMLKARRELADIDTQIQQEIQSIISNLEAQDQIARQRTASVEASVARSKGALAGNNRASVRLDELQRNADAIKTLYDSYLNRFKETTSQQGLETSDARDRLRSQGARRAELSEQEPKPDGGADPGGAGRPGRRLRGRATGQRHRHGGEPGAGAGLAYLGSIPALASTLDNPKASSKSLTAPVDFVIEKPLSSFAESFRNLRASVLFSRVGQQVKVIAVTSSLPGEGKTTTALALARTMAISGARPW